MRCGRSRCRPAGKSKESHSGTRQSERDSDAAVFHVNLLTGRSAHRGRRGCASVLMSGGRKVGYSGEVRDCKKIVKTRETQKLCNLARSSDSMCWEEPLWLVQ